MTDRWAVSHIDNIEPVNVWPLNDVIEHELDEDCVCGPDVSYFDDDGSAFDVPVISHHSLDGREQSE